MSAEKGMIMIFRPQDKLFEYLNFASRLFGADARRVGRRCISILQATRNKADAPK
ncbi:MAG: hypothetical protein WC299_14445 [Kiritimatiellia bacterium]